MKTPIREIADHIKDVLKAKKVPMLMSSPGMGKSSIIRAIADEYQLKIIDIRLSQSDPTDLLGFPSINIERTKASYVPMNTFPIEGDEIPLGYKGWLILMDEFNSAPRSVVAAAYKIILERQIGEFNLHKNVAIVAAGNLATDRAIVNDIGNAMKSRLIHFEIEIDPKHWIKWAIQADIDYRIIAYIGFSPDRLLNFDPEHDDYTFECPRTWEFMSDIIKRWKEIPVNKLPILTGTIGEGGGRQFYGYCQVFKELPTLASIISNYNTISIPSEPSTKYAISGLISSSADRGNIDPLMKFVSRLPIEFQVITVRGILIRNKALLSTEGVREWLKVNAQELAEMDYE